MKRLLPPLILLLCAFALAPAGRAQFNGFSVQTKADLLLDHSTAKPGSTILAGVRLKMAKNWHTYWRNPGEIGKATEIDWKLPSGITAGTIHWPVPHKSFSFDLGGYEYSGEAVLLVPLTIAAKIKPGEHLIKADLNWLECENEGACVPGKGSVAAKLIIGEQPVQGVDGEVFQTAKAQLPKTDSDTKLTAWWDGPVNADKERKLILEWPATGKRNDFYAYHFDLTSWQINPRTERVSNTDGRIRVRKTLTLTEGNWPTEITGLIVNLGENPKHPSGIEVSTRIQASAPPPPPAKTTLSSLGAKISNTFGIGSFGGPKANPSLQLNAKVAKPGSTITAMVVFKIADNWHTYWRNPGSSFGLPPTFDFELPEGITADVAAQQWPVPEKKGYPRTTTLGGTDYSYEFEGGVGILIPIKLTDSVAKGTHELKLKLKWLECETDSSCVQQDKTLTVELTVGDEAEPSADRTEIDRWRTLTPQTADPAPRAYWDGEVSTNQRALTVEWTTSATDVDFYSYEPSDGWKVDPETETLDAGTNQVRLRKIVTLNSGEWPTEVRGMFVVGPHSERKAFEATIPIETIEAAAAAGGPAVASETDRPLLYWLSLAFLGGLILNIMPCVLPVISLKILGFVNQSKEEPAQVKKLGFVYCIGVLVSFFVMALMVIAVQKAGNIASWGMQFGNPVFLVTMITLVTLVALNLFGVFEVTLSGNAMTAASSLASKHGPAGAFFNGVLATALATPCTAPFLAPALGFAFLQPPSIIVTMFLTVGAGLAVPYLILSMKPNWLRFLPKPGNWMVGFKTAMGFPMLATAMWLLWVSTRRFGRDGVLWLGLFLVMISLAVWIWGEFVQRGSKRKGLAMFFSLTFLISGYAFALEKKLNWRNPTPPAVGTVATMTNNDPDSNKINWQPWSQAAIDQARADGHPVLVDFTADWCQTCKANKNIAIDVESTRHKLKEADFVTLIADNTLVRDDIALELRKYQRAGVPLVLVYPADQAKPPIVLPTALKPSIVHDAIDQAVK